MEPEWNEEKRKNRANAFEKQNINCIFAADFSSMKEE